MHVPEDQSRDTSGRRTAGQVERKYVCMQDRHQHEHIACSERWKTLSASCTVDVWQTQVRNEK